MADKITLKNWYRTGLKPLQEQFWAWMDSYWHKDEKIPITAIEHIEEILDAKADAEVLVYHLTDEMAHADLFAKSKIYAPGQFLIFKMQSNSDNSTLQPGDCAAGWLPDGVTFIPFGKYLGGDIADVENSWITSPIDFSPKLPVLNVLSSNGVTTYVNNIPQEIKNRTLSCGGSLDITMHVISNDQIERTYPMYYIMKDVEGNDIFNIPDSIEIAQVWFSDNLEYFGNSNKVNAVLPDQS